jgi:S-adenosylmethionine:tRNA ribosyltransferase-isomerase
LEDAERYQTIYAREEGSAAAPTAGLHFTPRVFEALREKGVGVAYVTLHVGIATFRPVKVDDISEHQMHAEWFHVPEETARAIAACTGRVISVGTTTMRCLESAAADDGVRAGSGLTRLYVTPGYRFRVVDALLTNFHMPKSSLLILVAAFAGLDLMRNAYQDALASGYRFLSFGDAMFLERAEQA